MGSLKGFALSLLVVGVFVGCSNKKENIEEEVPQWEWWDSSYMIAPSPSYREFANAKGLNPEDRQRHEKYDFVNKQIRGGGITLGLAMEKASTLGEAISLCEDSAPPAHLGLGGASCEERAQLAFAKTESDVTRVHPDDIVYERDPDLSYDNPDFDRSPECMSNHGTKGCWVSGGAEEVDQGSGVTPEGFYKPSEDKEGRKYFWEPNPATVRKDGNGGWEPIPGREQFEGQRCYGQWKCELHPDHDPNARTLRDPNKHGTNHYHWNLQPDGSYERAGEFCGIPTDNSGKPKFTPDPRTCPQYYSWYEGDQVSGNTPEQNKPKPYKKPEVEEPKELEARPQGVRSVRAPRSGGGIAGR